MFSSEVLFFVVDMAVRFAVATCLATTCTTCQVKKYSQRNRVQVINPAYRFSYISANVLPSHEDITDIS